MLPSYDGTSSSDVVGEVNCTNLYKHIQCNPVDPPPPRFKYYGNHPRNQGNFKSTLSRQWLLYVTAIVSHVYEEAMLNFRPVVTGQHELLSNYQQINDTKHVLDNVL